jgi:hypothetical protein
MGRERSPPAHDRQVIRQAIRQVIRQAKRQAIRQAKRQVIVDSTDRELT